MTLEEEVFRSVLSILEKKEKDARIIVDTGGSLVYTPSQYCQLFKQYVRIVYLKIDKTLHKTLIDNYLSDPIEFFRLQ
jgi:shikimate kinase